MDMKRTIKDAWVGGLLTTLGVEIGFNMAQLLTGQPATLHPNEDILASGLGTLGGFNMSKITQQKELVEQRLEGLKEQFAEHLHHCNVGVHRRNNQREAEPGI